MTRPFRRARRWWLLVLLLCSTPALADSRIRTIDYDPSAVVHLDGCFGFQTMIEFAHGEKIGNIGVGDASHWLVAVNKRADILFVKPAYASAHSNMTISTDRHSYAFELSAQPSAACRRGRVVYVLQFRYPADEAAAAKAAGARARDDAAARAAAQAAAAEATPPAHRNSDYTFSGATGNVPQRVFDDGSRTWFHWAKGSATPAVFAVGADQSETPVAFTAQGDYLVADRVAPAFVLRSGNAVAVLYNDAYQMPALDAASPQPQGGAAGKGTLRAARKSLAEWFRRHKDAP